MNNISTLNQQEICDVAGGWSIPLAPLTSLAAGTFALIKGTPVVYYILNEILPVSLFSFFTFNKYGKLVQPTLVCATVLFSASIGEKVGSAVVNYMPYWIRKHIS